ncbi:MAG TPA: alpha/beta fold hydrolase [Anaeromyxobacteraceae bacterium]|nr:alpha/beta fold hydrolase [Anaeromyxobacteraceae bacterium]
MKILSIVLSLAAAQVQAPAAPAAPPPAPAVAPAPAAPAAAPAPAGPTSTPGMAPVAGRPNLLQLGVSGIPDALWQRAEQLLEARSARLLDVSDSGDQVLVTTRFGATMQLHVVERPMGARTQVTFGREPVTQGAFLPGDPSVIFFLRDVGGSENWQIHRLDRRTGAVERITDGKSRHEALVLSPDGKRLAYAGTGRNGKDTDVYVAATSRAADARRLFEAEGTWQPVDFSPDGGRLLVRRFRSIADSDLFLVDVATGERRALTPSTGKASVGPARFAADGKSVYLVTDRSGDFDELYRVDLADPAAAPRPLTRTLRWDVEGLAVARDGSRVALTVNADGASRLYFLEPRSGRLTPGELPQGVASGLKFPRQKASSLFLGLGTPRSPGDVWQAFPGKKGLTRWTWSEMGGIDPATLAEPVLVRYPARDGVSIPAWYYAPPGGGKRPVVIFWHGGPEAQERPTFQPLAQLLLQGGIGMLIPNVRGSHGYGKAYLAMDDGVKREESLGDIGATLDWIATRPELDASRVGVYGGSYGGYMVLATAAFFPSRIRSAVDVVGISSIPTFLESTAPYRRDLRRAEYGDERDPAVRAVQERISPLNRVGDITAALYVIQGKNDPRVPQSEAEQIVAAVRGKGKDVWYLLALDEGHGFQKKENRDYALVSTVAFLERTLLN